MSLIQQSNVHVDLVLLHLVICLRSAGVNVLVLFNFKEETLKFKYTSTVGEVAPCKTT